MSQNPDAPGSGNGGDSEPTATGAAASGAGAAEQKTQPPLAVNAQYVKDLSFEAPATPGILAEVQKQPPDISINVDVRATRMQEPTYEVVLHIRAECKVAEATAFIVELSYAGLFSLHVQAEHLQPVLLVECPRLIFPFARHIIANATRDGGFPPLMLGPVDFLAMYRSQLEKAQADAAATSNLA